MHTRDTGLKLTANIGNINTGRFQQRYSRASLLFHERKEDMCGFDRGVSCCRGGRNRAAECLLATCRKRRKVHVVSINPVSSCSRSWSTSIKLSLLRSSTG